MSASHLRTRIYPPLKHHYLGAPSEDLTTPRAIVRYRILNTMYTEGIFDGNGLKSNTGNDSDSDGYNDNLEIEQGKVEYI